MIKLEPFEIREAGIVKEIKKGIVKISGLTNCSYGQWVQIKDVFGLIIGFDAEKVLALLLEEEGSVDIGDKVWAKTETFEIPVGDAFLGRIINPLAQAVDGKAQIDTEETSAVFREASGIMERIPITEPLYTGIKIIDTSIPIGRGQRELIIGDRVTGKSTLAIDAIINQKGKGVSCVYCWVGGSFSALSRILQILEERKALDYTIIVAAPASSSPGQQYLAPYVAATLGEYFMYKGRQSLVVFDDLSKHAWVWRQLSLLLERPPGREAYPGDIFYIHSQLMERAGKLSPELGGGSMTFLPIVETQQGDVTGYISSNLISMTDGQIYLSAGLSHEGFKPSIDMGLSVSRIGSKVQNEAMKEVSGRLRLEYAQYRELMRLARFKTKVAREVSERLRKGEVLRELFMQAAHRTVSWEEQVVLFYAFARNILDMIPADGLSKFKSNIYEYILNTQPQVIKDLTSGMTLTNAIKAQLDKSFLDFLKEEKIV